MGRNWRWAEGLHAGLCLSGHLCPRGLGVSVSGAAQAIVIFSSRLSCSYTHRKELLLASPGP